MSTRFAKVSSGTKDMINVNRRVTGSNPVRGASAAARLGKKLSRAAGHLGQMRVDERGGESGAQPRIYCSVLECKGAGLAVVMTRKSLIKRLKLSQRLNVRLRKLRSLPTWLPGSHARWHRSFDSLG